tara:strand:- start:91503 stop:92027 length:525 start_codon:yes stop_codon:yes gene_type:complete
VKLKKIAKIAEIISSVGIIVSLFYAAIQFSDNSKAIRSSNASNVVMSITSWYSELANNEQSSKIFYQFFIDPEELSPEERYQCVFNLHALLLNFQNAYYFDDEGSLDSKINKSISSVLNAVKSSKGFKYYWNMREESFAPEFKNYINSIISNKNLDINIDKLYERNFDFNEIEN